MTRHACAKCLGMLAMLAVGGCSAIQPDKAVPPPTEGLEYPSVGHAAPPKGQPMLSAEERRKLEADLDRYKTGTN